MRRIVLFLLISLSVLLGLWSTTARAELVVVVNARCGVALMTRNEVINIFFGRSRQFFNGVEAQPVDLADANLDRERFYQALVGKDLSQVDAYWSRQVFSGRTRPPPKVATPDDVIKWVVANPGGIGFVDAAKVDARVRVVHEFGH